MNSGVRSWVKKFWVGGGGGVVSSAHLKFSWEYNKGIGEIVSHQK
jgi:hypothetical protein